MAITSRTGLLGQVMKAFAQLNPGTVNRDIKRVFILGLVGTEEEMDAMTSWLTVGESLNGAEAMVRRFSVDTTDRSSASTRYCDLVICASACSPAVLGVEDYRVFRWNASDPDQTADDILDASKLTDLHLALAYWFKAFRRSINTRIIKGTSFENAVFVASTAIGDVIPTPLTPLISVAEAAGDIVVLTANQVRMLFRLAAANGKAVGYRELMPQIGSIVAAAFGWRALARELVGKIPFGGGMAAKAAVSYAGTWTVGEGVMVYFTTGRKLTGKEVRERFNAAMAEAREVGAGIANKLLKREKVTNEQLPPPEQPFHPVIE
jgi:uncharacterized protein (DUF697 family)